MMGLGVPKDHEGNCSHRICLVPTAESDRKKPGSEGATHPTWWGISAQAFSNLAYRYALYNVWKHS